MSYLSRSTNLNFQSFALLKVTWSICAYVLAPEVINLSTFAWKISLSLIPVVSSALPSAFVRATASKLAFVILKRPTVTDVTWLVLLFSHFFDTVKSTLS